MGQRIREQKQSETIPEQFLHSEHLFRRKLSSLPSIAVQGQGVWIEDSVGNRYLDAAGGCAVVNIGHGVAEIAQSMAHQVHTLTYVNGTQFTHPAAESLASALAPHLEATLPNPQCFFMCTGTEAVEAAIKLARQIWVIRGQTGKTRFISRTPSYHGSSLTGLSLSAREHYKIPFGPYLQEDWLKIPSPQGDGEDLDRARVLDEAIKCVGSETIAAFIAEPISGSSTGAVVPDEGYWERVQDICHQHDILLIADEVMCGMGRTGKWLASEHFGLKPDIITLGKGLNSGYAPLSAMVAKGTLVEEIKDSGFNFLHAGTYTHTPLICATGLAVLQYLEKHQLVDRAAKQGNKLHWALNESIQGLPYVGKIRGKGLFAGVEILEVPNTRKPFPRLMRAVEKLVSIAASRHGLILWPNVGHINGQDGDLVILAPPFTISDEELHLLIEKLVLSLKDFCQWVEQHETGAPIP